MTPMPELEMLDAANYALYRSLAERSGGRVVEHDGLTLVIGRHPSAVIVNTIFRTGRVSDPAAALAFALSQYASIGHGVSLLTTSHADAAIAQAAQDAGWTQLFDLIGMVLDGPIAPGSEPADSVVFDMDPTLDLATFRRIELSGFADSQDEAEMIEDLFADSTILVPADTATYLAGQAGAPRSAAAAAAMVVNLPVGSDQIGVIAWVATEPDRRRHGYGGLATQAASNRSFEMGAKAVVLQASPMGLPVYRRLGYRELSAYTIWAPPEG
jgi:GNAT superfamily N-acetyltransferase